MIRYAILLQILLNVFFSPVKVYLVSLDLSLVIRGFRGDVGVVIGGRGHPPSCPGTCRAQLVSPPPLLLSVCICPSCWVAGLRAVASSLGHPKPCFFCVGDSGPELNVLGGGDPESGMTG